MLHLVRSLLVVLLLCAPARADVFPDDPLIEVSAAYEYAPIRFSGELEPVIGNAIRVTDRNGLFARAVVRFLSPPPSTQVSPTEARTVIDYQHTYYGIYGDITTTISHEEIRERSPEEIQKLTNERIAERGRILSLNNYHTEVVVYSPQRDPANARGGSFNMRSTVVGNSRFSIELGVGYGTLKSNVCRADDESKCRYKFWGPVLRVMISLGRLGAIDFGYDYNFTRVGASGPYGSAWDPIRIGLTLNPIDRLFVRAKVIDAPYDLGKPGYGLEIGGRL